ncbi:MAG: histidine--tRNA ligase, partial [Planctomycetaceae bacterium]
KPQRGRFREFVQCDFDTIGTESNVADIETLLVIHDLMDRIGFSRFTIRVNNRLVLNGMLESLGLTGHTEAVLRALDKLPKVGAEAVIAEMSTTAGTTAEQAKRVLEFAGLQGTPDDILRNLEPLVSGNEHGARGIARLRELFSTCRATGIPSERIVLDVSIARGLDYYTGTIYETFLSDLPSIGSVCSGGRYDNLAGLFTNQALPGVGASLGLDRLLDAMGILGMLSSVSTPAQVLVTIFDEKHLADYLRVANLLRKRGIATELYPEAKKLGHQLKYASRKGFRAAVIAGEEEFQTGQWQVKDLASGTQLSFTESGLAEHLTGILAGSN